MEISFLGQGYEPDSINAVGNHLKIKFGSEHYNRFFCISAFASKAAASFLEECIESSDISKNSVFVIVGIDQDGTSKDALLKLNSLGINSYVFYQKESPIFHPKIYLFEGEDKTALIVGSSNLTSQGLFSNVESSLLVEFDNSEEEGLKLLSELKTYYSKLFDLSDPNLFLLSESSINSLVSMGIVPTNSEWKKRYQKDSHSGTRIETHSEIEIPKRKTAKVPKALKNRFVPQDNVVLEVVSESEIEQNLTFIEHEEYVLLWNSKNLTQRDLNIPTGTNTNPTGSMLFKKADYDIDQRHYFKDTIFSDLAWTSDPVSSRSHLLRAECYFKVIILGIDYGKYKLKLTHNSKTDTAAYNQNNAMTQVHWGSIKHLIANHELLNKKLYLLKNVNDGAFVMEIK